jgi:3-isopropylmalate/(R)-2-methylmalate dehydratase large subunit
MGQSFAEKILGARAGRPVQSGERLLCAPDLVLCHDDAAEVIRRFRASGARRLWDPSRVAISLDHCAPAATLAAATGHREVRAFVAEQGLRHFFDVQLGVGHQVLADEGFVVPGGFLVGSHPACSLEGALGALAVAVSLDEAALIWATGRVEITVPRLVRLEASGAFPPAVGAKDLMLRVLGAGWLPAGDGSGRALELCGDAVRRMSMASRMVLCSMAAAALVRTAYIEPDGVTLRYLGRRARVGFEPVVSDPDAAVEELVRVEVSELAPQVAGPGSPRDVVAVEAVAGLPIDQAVLGSCSGGRVEDLWTAARRLRGRRVHPRVRFIITPASSAVYTEALRLGLLVDLAEAGAMIMNPGCGPCAGAHQGLLAAGEVCISTGAANDAGRMGSPEAAIYLASADTVAASALAGCIADPRSA